MSIQWTKHSKHDTHKVVKHWPQTTRSLVATHTHTHQSSCKMLHSSWLQNLFSIAQSRVYAKVVASGREYLQSAPCRATRSTLQVFAAPAQNKTEHQKIFRSRCFQLVHLVGVPEQAPRTNIRKHATRNNTESVMKLTSTARDVHNVPCAPSPESAGQWPPAWLPTPPWPPYPREMHHVHRCITESQRQTTGTKRQGTAQRVTKMTEQHKRNLGTTRLVAAAPTG